VTEILTYLHFVDSGVILAVSLLYFLKQFKFILNNSLNITVSGLHLGHYLLVLVSLSGVIKISHPHQANMKIIRRNSRGCRLNWFSYQCIMVGHISATVKAKGAAQPMAVA